MKAERVAVMALCLLASAAFAIGQKELPTSASTAASAGAGVSGKGVLFYATVEDYQKATGKGITAYNEAPMLAERVKAGQLPPVTQRLPLEPMVVAPYERVGKYGGTLRAGAMNPGNSSDIRDTRQMPPLFMLDMHSESKLVMNIAKGYEFSNENRTFTVFLRKGMKWSDGAPFNADDFVFWYEDVLLNKDLTPAVSSVWKTGSDVVKLSKVDDTTVRFAFSQPYPAIVYRMAQEHRTMQYTPYAPAHYLKEYHLKYNPKANDAAKAAGYDSWALRFKDIYPTAKEAIKIPGYPVLDPWYLEKVDASNNMYFARNPYYFKVDTAGNQLPYIDREELLILGTPEVYGLKALAGELDVAWSDTFPDDFPVYKDNEKAGGYAVTMTFDTRGSLYTHMRMNPFPRDVGKQAIFRDLRFRQALSVAINRQEINQALFHGIATPRAATIAAEGKAYEDWMGKYFAQYDPALANKLLDEMGLKWDRERKTRLRPDGKPLSVDLLYRLDEAARGKMLEMTKKYWEAVGVAVNLKDVGLNYTQLSAAYDLDFAIWNLDNSESDLALVFGTAGFDPYAKPWLDWRDSGGKTGEEPPAEVKEYFHFAEQLPKLPYGTPEWLAAAKGLLTQHLHSLYHIGILGNAPKPRLIKNGLKNIPEDTVRAYLYRFWMVYYGDQWFWDE